MKVARRREAAYSWRGPTWPFGANRWRLPYRQSRHAERLVYVEAVVWPDKLWVIRLRSLHGSDVEFGFNV
jgi:hypothetical protein